MTRSGGRGRRAGPHKVQRTVEQGAMMRMRRGTSQKVALLGVVNLAVMAASPADAQDATGGAALEEVVVTATGTRISGFDAPTPLTQVSQEDLQAKAVQRVSDLLVDVPAFSANQNIGRTSA